jgi:class 3 adenylate cyclase
MSFYIHFTDPNSPEMIRALDNIPQCPGTCFFMDINKSTDLKYACGIADWGRKLNNTFNFLVYSNHFEKDVVKGIGDEIMLFIPDGELEKRYPAGGYYNLLEDIYASLFMISNHPDASLFLDCKVSIHYCTEVYNITFLEGANDYYGSDVDLTARLMTKCVENRMVLSEKYLAKVMNDLAAQNLPPDTGCLHHISDKFLGNFKGVPVTTEYRIIDVK